MANVYMPLYLGDWAITTCSLSPLAEHAFLKLILKLFDAKDKGILRANLSMLSLLFKCPGELKKVQSLLKILVRENLIVIKPLEEDMFQIISPKLNKDYRLSVRPEYLNKRIAACVFISNPTIRKIVFEKYGKKCLCCGSEKRIALDHVISVKNGGKDSLDNMQPLCGSCNSKKKDKTIDYRKTYGTYQNN